MGNAPWAPTQGAGSSGTAAPEEAKPNGQTTAAPSTDVQDVVDENDPRLISETLEANVEGDAYAQPAPPLDGKYRLKLKHEGVKQDGTDERKPYKTVPGKKGGSPYYQTGISCSIIDPTGKYDGIVVYPAFGGGANTRLQRDKSTQVTTILHRIKKPDGQKSYAEGVKLDQKGWMDLLIKVLATEPEIGGELQWEASCGKCGEIAKANDYKDGYPTRTTGMHHFPQEQDSAKRKAGQLFSPELKCAVNPAHGYSRARAIVTRFLHLHELK
jgi:hypothetical protein